MQPLKTLLILSVGILPAHPAAAQEAEWVWHGIDSIRRSDGSYAQFLHGTIRWPADSPRVVVSEDNPNFRYHREIISIQFKSRPTRKALRAFVKTFRAEPLGNGPSDELHWTFRFPDPGDTWDSLQKFRRRLARHPGIQSVLLLPYGELPKLR